MLERLKDKTILFLEDNVEFAANTIALLQVFVRSVYHAKNISEAHQILHSDAIDIIICDVKLKNENGLNFIRDFREKNSATPILIISGHKDEEFLFRAIPLRLTAYLLKPIKYETLIDALISCLEVIDSYQIKKIELKEGWYYDTENKCLHKEGEGYNLNKKEALFMELLAQNRDRLITKEMINAAVWQFEVMSDSAITNFILRIRRRFGKNFIYTLPDIGYRLKT
ncbi:response regulator [Sulfuricurvum sp.]|uniref:response regulator transcription factor n=1 Tax=Sulfuricurvum sp. TaxID=2025608 RepID=UPI002606CEFF|nr:response regulator [Sulfuricurvum sp.]MDD2781768.1 response regulator [Sulfuricurvum sp.]